MNYLLTIILVTISCLNLNAQCNSATNLICAYYWDDPSQPVSAADIGPDAMSISQFATIDVGGNNGTHGLNPGPHQINIDMVLRGVSFTLPGIEISLDYQREREGQANFYTRGVGPNRFNFGQPGGGNLQVEFSLDNGSGTPVHINSGNIYAIPNDDTYRNYKFIYDPCTGIAEVSVNNNVIYTHIATPGWTLYWEPASNVIIGDLMDAYGNDVSLIDNLEISEITSILPIELTYFNAFPTNNEVTLDWETSSEINNEVFLIERSSDGSTFEVIGEVQSRGESHSSVQYQFIDQEPLLGASYYRLMQRDFDQSFSYSETVHVNFAIDQSHTISTYPNPAINELTIQFDEAIDESDIQIELYDIQGHLVFSTTTSISYKVTISTEELLPGSYMLRTTSSHGSRTKLIQKQ